MVRNYVRRGEWFHYMRRVPKHLSPFDKRTHVRISLKTKEEKEAQRLSSIYDDFVERYWKELVKTGNRDEGLSSFKQAKALAQAHGFAYKDMSAVLESPLEEILSRVEAVADSPSTKAPALLGTVKKSSLPLENCLERYWPLCADRLLDRSDNQIRKFKNPKIAAMKKFITAVGNLSLSEIERRHILQFRAWLVDKVVDEHFTGATANKCICHVKDILHTVALSEEVHLDVRHLFAEVKLKAEVNSRPPFEASFVRDTILKSGALDGLNEQARLLVHLMVETGARESELIGLMPNDFFLDTDIPHIWIRKNSIRALKTKTSDRQIPLVGVALTAAQQIASTGLTRYQKTPDSASNTINKFLRENGLRPTSKHTLYSLRHTFKDRLRDAGAPEEIMDELMGHKKAGPKYGRGHMMGTKHDWLRRITFTAFPRE